MRDTLFFRLGIWVCRARWFIIVSGLAVIFACAVYLPEVMSPFQSTGFIDEQSESALAQEYIDKKLGYHHHNQLLILYHSHTLHATQANYIHKIKASLAGLENFPIKHDIILPDANTRQISKDKHSAYVVIVLHRMEPLDHALLTQFKASIKTPRHMRMYMGGEAIFTESVNKQTQKDLYKADMIAAPVSVIVLILVFGTLIAALIPMCLGGGCALIILTLLYFLGHAFTLSIFTINIALLLGLCLSLDYSLFIVSRFRAELRAQRGDVSVALAKTLATAGRAVFFSGLAVFISLSALLLFPINILFSIGVGGLSAALVAVGVAIFLLPAVLAVFSDLINRFSVYSLHEKKRSSMYLWRKLATAVVRRPVLFFVMILMLLLCLGYPFLNVRFGVSDFHILREHSDSPQFF